MEEIFGPGGSPCEAPGGGFEGGGFESGGPQSPQSEGPQGGEGGGFEAVGAGAESAGPGSAGQRAGQRGGAGMAPAAAAAPGAGSGPDRAPLAASAASELPPRSGADGGLPPRSGPRGGDPGLVAAMRADPELKTLALKAALAAAMVPQAGQPGQAGALNPGAGSGPDGISPEAMADGGLPPRSGPPRRGDYSAEIRRLDPTVTSWKDVAGADTDRSFFRLVFGQGVDAVTAYKAVFFDRLLQGRAEAARQQALNEARAKSHLAPVGGGEGSAGEMTAAELEEWAAYGFGPAEARRYKNRFKKER